MSLSPMRYKSILEHQLNHRLAVESPCKSDISFFQRKCARLQDDLTTVQDELSSARLRLRRAEDFQIKYDLVVKQNSNLLAQNDLLTKDIQSLKVQIERNKLRQEDEAIHHKDFSKQKNNLQSEVERWKKTAKEAQERNIEESKTIGEQNEGLQKKETQKYKREWQQREDRLQGEIRQLKKVIAEKQTVQNVIGLKVDRIRKEKEEEIGRLSQALDNQRKDLNSGLEEKDQELVNLQAKFDKMINYELENIKLNQDNQDEIFSTEVNGLKEMLTIKNDQIAKLLTYVKSTSEQSEKDKTELKKQISRLKEQIYKIERENEIELYNTMQRLTKIHAVDIQELENKYKKLLDAMDIDKKDLEKLLKQKDDEMEAGLKELERIRRDLQTKIKDRELRIAQLMERLKDVGATNINQIKYLHESFHKIEEEKEVMASGYQENISFMDQQIKKLAASLQLKQITIRTLEQEMASMKKSAADQQKQLLEKWRNERKERQQEKEKDREEREKMDEDHRTKEKEWKNKERQLEKDKEREEREKNRVNFVLEETQKDNSRLNGYIRQLDDALKRELKKNQLSTLDTGGVRREMVNELQRQKSDLEAIKRMEVDQITKTFQIEISKLTNQNNKLQGDLLQKSISLQSLQNQMKKIQNTSRNIQKINKEKMLEYQRKMATLNSEINLTQNLYQNFLQAKSRAKKD